MLFKSFLICLFTTLLSCTMAADERRSLQLAETPHEGEHALRHGLSLDGGPMISDGDDFDLYTVTWHYVVDHPSEWGWSAFPDYLELKAELSAGVATVYGDRFQTSASMMLMYFPPWLQTELLQPFLEAGVGVIYTDYKVMGQGLRWNFTPRAGLGTNIDLGETAGLWFVSARWEHISNAGLDEQNAGLDAVIFSLGHWF